MKIFTLIFYGIIFLFLSSCLSTRFSTENIMKLESLKKKFIAFGFNTKVIDGHNYSQILNELNKFDQISQGKRIAVQSSIGPLLHREKQFLYIKGLFS